MFKKIKLSQVPKRTRTDKKSGFEGTKTWKSLEAYMLKGIPKDETAVVVLTKELQEETGITNKRAIFRFLQKYIETHELPYIVKTSTQEDGESGILVHLP